MGLTSEAIVFQGSRLRRQPPVKGVLRVRRRAGIRHVIPVSEGKSRED